MRAKEGNADAGLQIDWARVRERVVAAETAKPGALPGKGGPVVDAVDECLRAARQLAGPRAASAEKRILSCADGCILVEGGLTIPAKALSKHIRGATAVRLFVLTIGSGLEKAATVLMEGGDELRGYLLDRIGSFAVESLAEAMERGLRGSYGASGMSVSARFSPGYCDWPVSGQSALDGALGFSKAGVALTESLMMTPRKSISGLVAVGPKGLFSSAVSQCDFCGEKTCDFRRKQ